MFNHIVMVIHHNTKGLTQYYPQPYEHITNTRANLPFNP